MIKADIAIVGGGIIGAATAYQLSRIHPGKVIFLLEKEAAFAQHQTGRNSGVLHSGIYYKPGSQKALNCREGKALMEAFCQEEGIPLALCGKVIVAVHERERPYLRTLYERGQANGVRCEMIGRDRLRELEPHVAGIEAIHVPEAGILDYGAVCRRMALRASEVNTRLLLNTKVHAIEQDANTTRLITQNEEISCKHLVNCAGLYSDVIAKMAGISLPARIIPFRGEYFVLTSEAESFCKTLIYPVPDPAFPFLGVHFTRMIHGGVECGPNAVLAFAREGYRFGKLRPAELWQTLSYGGFQRLASRYWRTGLGEMWRSLNKRAFVRALRRLVPAISEEHLIPAPAGVRAQAISAEGQLVDDFLIHTSARDIHVVNAPSPGATSSLNIGHWIVTRLAERF